MVLHHLISSLLMSLLFLKENNITHNLEISNGQIRTITIYQMVIMPISSQITNTDLATNLFGLREEASKACQLNKQTPTRFYH